MFYQRSFEHMACDTSTNCSSRGSCEEGVCVCTVQFAGDHCSQTNTGFTAAFSSVFSILFLVSFVQLILCIQSEHKRLKHASIWSACRITTQKLLYFLALIAALTRVLYFSLMGVIPDKWLATMEMAYHPFLITGMSLVVCYWSEAFFLEDVSANASKKACFLSKSFVAFSVFNLLLYLTVIAQFIVVVTGDSGIITVNHWLNGAFQSFFAIVLFVIYIVFMTVGVEMFFKIRGAFNRRESEEPSTSSETVDRRNNREVFKSRLAFIFQAMFILLMVLCVVSNAVETMWMDKFNVNTRNIHVIIYRIAEVGVVLWFPCVLWNSTCPEQLWFLNPRCLLKLRASPVLERLVPSKAAAHRQGYKTFSIPETEDDADDLFEEESECWICYDQEREDAGPFISPCLCKGGMAKVHHDCLQRWLIENPSNEGASCQVCKHQYAIRVEPAQLCTLLVKGNKKAAVMVTMLAICVTAPCLSVYVFRNCKTLDTVYKVLILGFSIIVELVCLKILGLSFSKFYQMTRRSAMRILNYDRNDGTEKHRIDSSPQKIRPRSNQISQYEVIGVEVFDERTSSHSSAQSAVTFSYNGT